MFSNIDSQQDLITSLRVITAISKGIKKTNKTDFEIMKASTETTELEIKGKINGIAINAENNIFTGTNINAVFTPPLLKAVHATVIELVGMKTNNRKPIKKSGKSLRKRKAIITAIKPETMKFKNNEKKTIFKLVIFSNIFENFKSSIEGNNKKAITKKEVKSLLNSIPLKKNKLIKPKKIPARTNAREFFLQKTKKSLIN